MTYTTALGGLIATLPNTKLKASQKRPPICRATALSKMLLVILLAILSTTGGIDGGEGVGCVIVTLGELLHIRP